MDITKLAETVFFDTRSRGNYNDCILANFDKIFKISFV